MANEDLFIDRFQIAPKFSKILSTFQIEDVLFVDLHHIVAFFPLRPCRVARICGFNQVGLLQSYS